MAKQKSELSHFQIKNHVKKLHDEIISEMDNFLLNRNINSSSSKRSFSHVFPELEKTLASSHRIKTFSCGPSFVLREQIHSSKKPSFRFLSSGLKEGKEDLNKKSQFSSNVNEKEKVSTFSSLSSTKTKLNRFKSSFNLINSRNTRSNEISALKYRSGRITGGKKEKEVSSTINFSHRPKIDSNLKTSKEEITDSELEALLSPLAGEKQTAEMEKSNKKLKYLIKEDLYKETEDFISDPSLLSLKGSFWRNLEKEETLKNLFTKVSHKILNQDTFSRREKTQKQAMENSASKLSSPLKKDSVSNLGVCSDQLNGALSWAGELRWHLVARADLENFRINLPKGFVLCDGSSLQTDGVLNTNPDKVVGRLPHWIEEVDKDHIVVGILRAHKG